ncbi:target of Nesh-SH3 isoform X2 [Pygocentrus nattereri]|uniref:Fibronectin type-III domain-containing protein n=1 Tax=Pygocentrus nattereri TaxID=42514 RepID=A0AAR2LS70_PYGNA|nr:target of Nesh-SH3 isoform X2 [Pygocentrus nattereri]
MRNFLHIFIIISEVLILNFICASTLRVQRENMKVRINATDDTIILKFMRPHMDAKLEGYILGYGSSMFSKQFIQLPKNGEPYETEIDAEPKYLIAVKQVKANEVKKHCTEKVTLEKPLHLVIGSVTPTSVLLSWGTLLKTPYTETDLDDCIEEGEFTVRYRENEPSKQWNYQTCPTTSTVIDNLKPDTPYEFGVRADIDTISGAWSPPVMHNTADVDIHKLLEEKPAENRVRPQEPIIKTPQAFLPPVPGTGSDDITSPPSEDSLSLTQTFFHTAVRQPPSKTTNTFQSQQSTTSPLSRTSQQHHHTSQSTTSTIETKPTTEILSSTTISTKIQLSTTKIHLSQSKTLASTTETQPSTTNIKLNTTETQTSTTKSHPSIPEIVPNKINTHLSTNHLKMTEFHSIGQLQPTTSQPQTTTTQSQPSIMQSTVQLHVKTVQYKAQITPNPSSTNLRTTQQAPSKGQYKHSTNPHSQPNRTKSQPIITQPQPSTIQTQPITTQPQPRTTQPSTVQLHVSIYQSKPETIPQKPSPTKPRATTENPRKSHHKHSTNHRSQSNTTKSQAIVTPPHPTTVQPQNRTTQPQSKTTQVQNSITQTQKSTVKQQPSTSQFQFMTTQPMPFTTPRTTQMPRLSQSRKMQKKSSTAQPLVRTIQQQILTKPNTITEQGTLILTQPWTTKKQPNKIQQPTTSPENIYMTKQQPTLIQPKPTQESNTYYKVSTTTEHQQILNTNLFLRSTPLTLPKPKASTQKSIISQHITSQHPPYDNNDTPSAIDVVTRLWKQPQRSTTFQHRPVPDQDHQPTSSTIQYYNTTHLQYDKTESTPKSKPYVTNSPHSPTKHAPDVSIQPFNSKLVPTAKSNVNQNSPRAEKQAEAVNKMLQLNKAGRGILRNLSSSASVTCHSAHTVIRNGTARGCVPAVTKPHRMRVTPINRNNSLKRAKVHSGEEHKGLSMTKPSKQFLGPKRSRTAKKKGPNQVEKPIDKDKVTDLKQLEMDTLLSLKPHVAPATEVPDYQKPTPTSTLIFAFNGSRFDNSSVFSSVPVSDVDAMGKKRFVAPHVIYKTDKRPEEPCSVTHSLSFFPDEEVGDINVTGPPKNPPSNLTVVTVEGCSSFVILDWEKSDNETTEYEVTSSTKGPNGKEVSILTTNQTHTAVENLKPESSYEFTVTPKNELGSGPSSDPVTFSTESADPRVSEIPTGKNAIWSSFPFKADSYSECNGRQYVKRTWYRKFVGIQLCNSLRYKIYLSDSLKGKFYTIGDQTGYGEDHCQFVDSFLDGRTGGPLPPNQLPPTQGYFRAVRQEPVKFGLIGGSSHINYVAWYECGIPIPGSW